MHCLFLDDFMHHQQVYRRGHNCGVFAYVGSLARSNTWRGETVVETRQLAYLPLDITIKYTCTMEEQLLYLYSSWKRLKDILILHTTASYTTV